MFALLWQTGPRCPSVCISWRREKIFNFCCSGHFSNPWPWPIFTPRLELITPLLVGNQPALQLEHVVVVAVLTSGPLSEKYVKNVTKWFHGSTSSSSSRGDKKHLTGSCDPNCSGTRGILYLLHRFFPFKTTALEIRDGLWSCIIHLFVAKIIVAQLYYMRVENCDNSFDRKNVIFCGQIMTFFGEQKNDMHVRTFHC
jgi:hypothetical protein